MKGSPIGSLLSGFGPGLLGGIGSMLTTQANNASQPDHSGGDKGPKNNPPTAPPAHAPTTARPNSMKHGGIVQKTGLALIHKGEKVTPANEVGKPKVSLHRALADLHKGGLHRALKVPTDKPIPADKLEKARNSDNPHVAHMANFAKTMEGWKH